MSLFCNKIEDLSAQERSLVEKAKEATTTSYAPYSHFHVGAAVLLNNDQIICGSNQENAAYGSCVCAERVALLYATANFSATPPIAIAIAAQKDGQFTPEPCTPCGECRQVLLEMQARFGQDIRVIMYGENKCLVAQSVTDLLPSDFGQDSLHTCNS